MGKVIINQSFDLKGELVEVVNHFKYLGIIFSKNGKFINTLKDNIDKGRRAFFLLLRKFNQQCIPLDCQIELFQTCIEPILLYGCEIWGIYKFDILESFRLKCLKMITKAKASTPAYMIYGELGLLPLKLTIYKRILSYWGKLVTSPDERISHTLYRIMLNDSLCMNARYEWPEFIKNILCQNGFGDVWLFQNQITKYFGDEIDQRLLDCSIQELTGSCSNSNKGRNYILLKEDRQPETYFKLLNHKEYLTLFKHRTSNHMLLL